jgi:hypothetical protein
MSDIRDWPSGLMQRKFGARMLHDNNNAWQKSTAERDCAFHLDDFAEMRKQQ